MRLSKSLAICRTTSGRSLISIVVSLRHAFSWVHRREKTLGQSVMMSTEIPRFITKTGGKVCLESNISTILTILELEVVWC